MTLASLYANVAHYLALIMVYNVACVCHVIFNPVLLSNPYILHKSKGLYCLSLKRHIDKPQYITFYCAFHLYALDSRDLCWIYEGGIIQGEQ